MSRILIVDDEASIAWALREFLSDEGHQVLLASSAEEALQVAEDESPDAVMLDVRLPGMDGLSALGPLRSRIGLAPVIVMTAFGNLETAVRAVEGGAFDYLIKPFDLDEAGEVIRRALETGTRPAAPRVNANSDNADVQVGASAVMQEVFKRIALVAPTDAPVLITGESGTGKELVARAIHRHGSRRDGPFVPACLPALSPGVIEGELFGHVKGAFTGASVDRKGLLQLAHGGTVFLDEIGDISPGVQVKLLRAIEHREVTPVGDSRPRASDFRVVAATNRPLADLIARGEFREDLFFRLSVFPISLPPLRDRRDDIPSLAEHFLRRIRPGVSGTAYLSAEALSELRDRPWPGNVRELRNAVEHAAIVARGGRIQPSHLPAAAHVNLTTPIQAMPEDLTRRIEAWATREMSRQRDTSRSPSLYEHFLDAVEPSLLSAVLRASEGNRAAAAQVLGIHRATLRQKLKRHGIG